MRWWAQMGIQSIKTLVEDGGSNHTGEAVN
jgi:hypothetical protein